MSDLDPAELSAFLDGELGPARVKEIEALIAADPEVRAGFDRLGFADRRLRSIAKAAAFRPQIHWPQQPEGAAIPWLAPTLFVILVAWGVGKLTSMATMSFVVNTAALVVLVACLAPIVFREAWPCEPSAE